MKTKELLAIAFLGLAIVSCNQDEFAQEVHEKPTVEQNTPEKVAKFLTSIPLSENVVKEVHNVVSTALKSNTGESYAFKEILSENGGGEIMTRAGVQKSLLGELMKQYANTPDVRAVNENVPLDLSLLEESNLQIYWPYSENWDGKTLPAISFPPEDEDQEWNIAYIKKNSELEVVRVDEEFAEKHPLWIINNEALSFKEVEIESNLSVSPTQPNPNSTSEGDPVGTTVYTTYLGRFMASKQYDSFWAGGSEFVVLVGSVPNISGGGDNNSFKFDSDLTRIPVYRSRKDIRKNRWVDIYQPIVSNWKTDLERVVCLIFEEDQGSATTYQANFSTIISGEEYKFDANFPVKSHDDIIGQMKFERSYIFSDNNNLGGDWKSDKWLIYTLGGVNFTVPYKLGKVVY